VQSPEFEEPGTNKEKLTTPDGVSLSVLRLEEIEGLLPVVLFIHCAGCVFGNDEVRVTCCRWKASAVRGPDPLSPLCSRLHDHLGSTRGLSYPTMIGGIVARQPVPVTFPVRRNCDCNPMTQ
jgi:hypothetical protein